MTDLSLASVAGQLLPSLALVIGGLLLVRWWTAKARGGVQQAIKVVARTGLTRAAQVAVVRVGTQHYLVGVTDTNVALLAELPDDVTGVSTEDPSGPLFGALDALNTGTATSPTHGPRTGLVGRLQQATLRRQPTSHAQGAQRVRRV